MKSRYSLFLPLLVGLAICSALSTARTVKPRGRQNQKVATIFPTLLIPVSSCNPHNVFATQDRGAVWFKPSLEGPRSRPGCVGGGGICRMNETALYGEKLLPQSVRISGLTGELRSPFPGAGERREVLPARLQFARGGFWPPVASRGHRGNQRLCARRAYQYPRDKLV
jgi:hypothetical protein